MRYRAAVVGCGNIGVLFEQDPSQEPPATHAAAFRMNPRTELVALVDSEPEPLAHAASRFPEAEPFPTCRDMLEAIRPDIVAVATPLHTHRKLVEECAAARVRTIVCEKPIALTLEDATSMIDACRAAGAVLFVNHTRRFDPLIRSARDEVLAGGIGEVLRAECLYTRGLMNTGTHMLDLLRFFLGDATAVSGKSNGPVDEPLPGDMGVDGEVEFAGGARATIRHVDDSVFDVTLIGRGGGLKLTRLGYRIERTGGARAEDTPRSFMGAMVDHVVACLDGKEVPVSRGEDGHAALALVLALRRSAERGGARVPLATGETSAP